MANHWSRPIGRTQPSDRARRLASPRVAAMQLAGEATAVARARKRKRKLLEQTRMRRLGEGERRGHVPVVGVDDEVLEEALGGGSASARAEAAEAEIGAEEREAAAAGGGDVVAHHLHLVLLRGPLLLLLRLRVALRHPPLRPQSSPHRPPSAT